MHRRFLAALLAAFLLTSPAFTQAFQLAPAVAVEAEHFTIDSGWKVVQNGQGNYMVDIIGFNHISGERVLSLGAKSSKGSAHHDIQVPETGKYRLWVRYEYPAFCETRFRVVVEQGGQTFAAEMGKKDSVRYAALTGRMEAKAQHDPPWGPEGLMEEVVTVPMLQKGPARLRLEGVEQEQKPGVSANRNIDLVYLTRDTEDRWLAHYQKRANLYPILEAFRDTRGPRWEMRFTNKAAKPAAVQISHVYNRIPWGASEIKTPVVAPGAVSPWIGLAMQDTAHFAMVRFTSQAGPFTVELRPVGSKETERTLQVAAGEAGQVFLPPYPSKDDRSVTPEEAIDRVLADLKSHKAPGKSPTQALCFGGWMPLGQNNAYGRKYAELYAALGFRSAHPANSGPAQMENLKVFGIGANKAWMAMGYRNPPTKANIDRVRGDLARRKLDKELLFYDYGDEIGFSEWLDMCVSEDVSKAKALGGKVTPSEVVRLRWLDWLKKQRPKATLETYWLAEWGPFNFANMRPDSTAHAARANPTLYIDSLLFYEDTAIRFAADGAKAVRAELGDHVKCGANYSCHPFYYPHSTMYIKWFRGGAADMGRHSEYFWQVAQPGPMINGYIAEHFRTGLRDTPRGVLRQYTMPHAPGNTDASFLRSAFSHLAHGATMLDFFGIGMNESFTENHIDHRAVSRFRALRDVTHTVGFVEDVLPKALAVPSRVALLVSESTERWDYAGIATDRAGHAHFGPDFRKTRLHFHLDRLGLWQALTFLGESPDLLTEADVCSKRLADYKVLLLVGDHWDAAVVPAVEAWVRAGGTAVSTAAAGLRDSYGKENDAWAKVAALQAVKTEQKITFLRPRQELPYLSPHGMIAGDGWQMPALATEQTLTPGKEATVVARFAKDAHARPAVVERNLGTGRVIHIAAHPGLAYLWSGLQPPGVPDRGPGTHTVPTKWDEGARGLLADVLKKAGVQPRVECDPPLMDTRLLAAPGCYLLPIANYSGKVGEAVTVRIRAADIGKAHSAHHGALPAESSGGVVTVRIPKLGYGDVLRFEAKK